MPLNSVHLLRAWRCRLAEFESAMTRTCPVATSSMTTAPQSAWCFATRAPEEILHPVLEVSVQRQPQRVATRSWVPPSSSTAGHDGAVGSDLDGLRARRARQEGIKLGSIPEDPCPSAFTVPVTGRPRCH